MTKETSMEAESRSLCEARVAGAQGGFCRNEALPGGRYCELHAPDARDITAELEIRQNELYLAMAIVEKMPASESQTECIVRLGERMRKLVELRGKSEVGRSLDV